MRGLKERYTGLAIIFLNTVLLLAVVNLALWAGARLFGHNRPFDPVAVYGLDRVAKAYPGWNQDDVIALDREMTKLDFNIYQYEPYTQFKHRPVQGRYLNIGSNGFRSIKNQSRWPPDPSAFNIFVFGGSTTFGVGVPDGETIPSYIQEFASSQCTLPVAVYNFGRLGFFSTQEAMLLYRLLSSGAIPGVAIFIDGINDFHSWTGDPDLTNQLTSLLESQNRPFHFLRNLPMTQAAARLRQWLSKPQHAGPNYSDPRFINRVIQRLRTNEALATTLCNEFHVKPVFILQPVPVYKYDLRYHFLNGADYARYFRYADGARYGYPVLATMRNDFEKSGTFLWLVDTQEGRNENLYVSDGLHYSGAFCRDLAHSIVAFLIESHILAAPTCKPK